MSSVADGTRGAAARAASTTGAAAVPAPPATPRTRPPQGAAAGHGEQEPALTQNVRFARAPAHTVNDLFDYSTRYGLSLYQTAVAPFPVKFDGDSKNVLSFANQFARRAKKCNWDATLTFKQNGKDLHLARNFGAVDKKVLLDHVKSYSGQAVRHNQVSAQIFECLEQSLEPDIHSAITNRREEYVINDEEDGLLFFMAILQHSQTHTRGTVGILQNSLNLLPQRMVECDNNIRQFNEQVTEIKNDLEARGHPPEETNFINQLFAGYMACADTKFTEYISNKQDMYNDGGNVTARSLMSDALNKFKWRVERHLWMEPTEDQKKIVALTSQVQQLKNRPSKNDSKDSKKNKNKNNNNNNTDDKKGDKKSDKDKETKYPEWKTIAPPSGSATSKVVNNRTYYWCTHHNGGKGLWVAHAPKDCKSAAKQKSPKTNTDTSAPSKLVPNQTLAAIAADDYDSDE